VIFIISNTKIPDKLKRILFFLSVDLWERLKCDWSLPILSLVKIKQQQREQVKENGERKKVWIVSWGMLGLLVLLGL